MLALLNFMKEFVELSFVKINYSIPLILKVKKRDLLLLLLLVGLEASRTWRFHVILHEGVHIGILLYEFKFQI